MEDYKSDPRVQEFVRNSNKCFHESDEEFTRVVKMLSCSLDRDMGLLYMMGVMSERKYDRHNLNKCGVLVDVVGIVNECGLCSDVLFDRRCSLFSSVVGCYVCVKGYINKCRRMWRNAECGCFGDELKSKLSVLFNSDMLVDVLYKICKCDIVKDVVCGGELYKSVVELWCRCYDEGVEKCNECGVGYDDMPDLNDSDLIVCCMCEMRLCDVLPVLLCASKQLQESEVVSGMCDSVCYVVKYVYGVDVSVLGEYNKLVKKCRCVDECKLFVGLYEKLRSRILLKGKEVDMLLAVCVGVYEECVLCADDSDELLSLVGVLFGRSAVRDRLVKCFSRMCSDVGVERYVSKVLKWKCGKIGRADGSDWLDDEIELRLFKFKLMRMCKVDECYNDKLREWDECEEEDVCDMVGCVGGVVKMSELLGVGVMSDMMCDVGVKCLVGDIVDDGEMDVINNICSSVDKYDGYAGDVMLRNVYRVLDGMSEDEMVDVLVNKCDMKNLLRISDMCMDDVGCVMRAGSKLGMCDEPHDALMKYVKLECLNIDDGKAVCKCVCDDVKRNMFGCVGECDAPNLFDVSFDGFVDELVNVMSDGELNDVTHTMKDLDECDGHVSVLNDSSMSDMSDGISEVF